MSKTKKKSNIKTETAEIESYVLAYFGGAQRSKHPYKYRALITLHDTTGQFATLFFHCDKSSLPKYDKLADMKRVSAHFTIDDYQNIVDLLRNEKPLYVHRNSQWPTMAVISTSKEPVGEAE